MSLSQQPALKTPTATKRGSSDIDVTKKSASGRNMFVGMALNMSWQLAIAVLVPVVGGVFLDKKLGSAPVCLFIGLAVAVIACIAVMWRTMQVANSMPVPKLTEKERQDIRKQYEAEDNE